MMTYHALGKFGRRQIDAAFLIFPRNIGFDTSCKLFPKIEIDISCKIVSLGANFHAVSTSIFWENIRNYSTMSSADFFLPSMLNTNTVHVQRICI